MSERAVRAFARVAGDLRQLPATARDGFRRTRVWSYGDVENNGVYYHPNLTHYAHQVFEEFFWERVGLQYVDLSRESEDSDRLRRARDIPRMTFSVQWLHQFMHKPMSAGDAYDIALDTVDVDVRSVAVRGWVTDKAQEVAAVVIWIRRAIYLPSRKPLDIPQWFPRC